LRTILDRLDNRGVSLDALIKMIMNKEADPYSLVHEKLNEELP